MTQSDVELLRQVPILSALDAPQLHVLAFSGTRMTLEAGEVLYEADGRVGAGYLVLEGRGEAVAPENSEPMAVSPGCLSIARRPERRS